MSMSELRAAVAIENELSLHLAEVSAQQQRLIALSESTLAANNQLVNKHLSNT